MGMEGKLRRVSEFELASYRRNPAKLYGEMLPFPAALSEAGKAISAMRNIQQSEVGRRIQERALSGQSPFPEDVEALQREMQEAMKDFPQFSTAIRDGLPGLSKDKKRLNLHKSWDCLN